MNRKENQFWNSPLTQSAITSSEVRLPEMLLGYFIGPFGALLSSGIFTSILQNYFTDVLKLDLSFLTGLQLFSTILIVAANLVVGQLIERTKALAGKARPWILLSALVLSIASVLMFIVPFQSTGAKMVWIAIAYNLYYAVAYPIYNTANSTLVPVSTRNSKQRATLASFTNMAGCHGRGLHGFSRTGVLCAEGESAAVVSDHAGSGGVYSADDFLAVQVHERTCHRGAYERQ